MTKKQLTHLQQLEAESIHIMREVAAEFDNPVMLYSVGKDSAVMLHLAMKAFAPGKPPFPLLHVDTTWKFKEMIQFRDNLVKELGIDLIVHSNQQGIDDGINPFDHARYTDIMKTDGLKQALDKHGLMRHLVAHVVMKKSHVLKNAFIHFVIKIIAGILNNNVLNYGIPTTAR